MHMCHQPYIYTKPAQKQIGLLHCTSQACRTVNSPDTTSWESHPESWSTKKTNSKTYCQTRTFPPLKYARAFQPHQKEWIQVQTNKFIPSGTNSSRTATFMFKCQENIESAVTSSPATNKVSNSRHQPEINSSSTTWAFTSFGFC